MSIASLVDRFGMTLWLFRPTSGIGADGQVSLTYAATGTSLRAFVQPNAMTSDLMQGRPNSRTSTTIYFSGAVDVRIDDELHDAKSGSSRTWRVTGTVVPGQTGLTKAAPHLTMTVVEAVEVLPLVSV